MDTSAAIGLISCSASSPVDPVLVAVSFVVFVYP